MIDWRATLWTQPRCKSIYHLLDARRREKALNVCRPQATERQQRQRQRRDIADRTNSANGAQYNSQGQARSASPLVTKLDLAPSPERAAYDAYFGPSGLARFWGIVYQGRRASRLPLAIISRAVGAVGSTCISSCWRSWSNLRIAPVGAVGPTYIFRASRLAAAV